MKLFLLRHGHAEPEAPRDSLRVLSAKGRAEVERQANENAAVLESIEACIVSPYVRAQQTADIVMQVMSAQRLESELLVPGANVNALIEYIYQTSQQFSSVLLVAHNPLLESLLAALCQFEPGSQRMQTASLASLECDVPARSCCEMQWIKHP